MLLNPSQSMMFSIKIYFDQKKQKFLSIEEIFSKKLQFAYDSCDFEKNNITIIENSEEDLKEMTNEFIHNFLMGNELTNLQIEYNKKILSLLKINLDKNNFYKLPIISNYFLKKYSFLI